jgi:hypothetical protein
MLDVDPIVFRHTFERELISWLGADYASPGGTTPGEGTDCSGLIVNGFLGMGLQIDDRSVYDFITDGIIMQDHPPVFGPRLAFATLYKSDGELRHIAYLMDERNLIHSTTGSTLGSGVIVSRISDFYVVKRLLGYVDTGVYWYNPSASRFLVASES